MTAIDIDLWLDVCAASDLIDDRGVCVRLDDQHIALFTLSGNDDVFALDNIDPFSGASVLSRGIVGDRGGVAKVSSPLYKQSFDLRTGRCLDDPTIGVAVFDARIVDGRVEVRRR